MDECRNICRMILTLKEQDSKLTSFLESLTKRQLLQSFVYLQTCNSGVNFLFRCSKHPKRKIVVDNTLGETIKRGRNLSLKCPFTRITYADYKSWRKLCQKCDCDDDCSLNDCEVLEFETNPVMSQDWRHALCVLPTLLGNDFNILHAESYLRLGLRATTVEDVVDSPRNRPIVQHILE